MMAACQRKVWQRAKKLNEGLVMAGFIWTEGRLLFYRIFPDKTPIGCGMLGNTKHKSENQVFPVRPHTSSLSLSISNTNYSAVSHLATAQFHSLGQPDSTNNLNMKLHKNSEIMSRHSVVCSTKGDGVTRQKCCMLCWQDMKMWSK